MSNGKEVSNDDCNKSFVNSGSDSSVEFNSIVNNDIENVNNKSDSLSQIEIESTASSSNEVLESQTQIIALCTTYNLIKPWYEVLSTRSIIVQYGQL